MNLRLEDLPLPLVNETLRVGARLTSFVQQLENLLGNCHASRTLGNGVQLEWESLTPLTRTPISFSTRNTPKDLQMAVDKLLSKGAIELVFRPETKGFFSRLFLVLKKTGFTSCHRSLLLERPSGYSAVQDGDPGFSPGFHQRERMDCVHRHTGRISSRSHGKVCTEIPQIHGERACVSVYMPSVRLGYLPSGIYQVAATSGPASAAPMYQAPCISGWLAHPSIVCHTGQNSCQFSPVGVTTPWMGKSISASPTWFPASSSILSACSSTRAPTPWHLYPKCG